MFWLRNVVVWGGFTSPGSFPIDQGGPGGDAGFSHWLHQLALATGGEKQSLLGLRGLLGGRRTDGRVDQWIIKLLNYLLFISFSTADIKP